MSKTNRILLALVATLLLVAPLAAQTTTGTISGVVRSTDGAPLPGVTVLISSDVLQGTRTVETDANGRFRAVNLPPGSYSVTYTQTGFSPVEESGVAVRIATDTSREVTMTPGVTEEILVQGEGVVVDTTKSTIDTQVDFEFVDSLPNNRLFQDVMSSAPGVNVNQNNPQVHGAADSDNVYLVDGVDTTDPRTQTWGTAINFDTIQEVQIQTAGMPAEFGRVQGGVVNLVTRSGGNEFHGSLRYVQTDVDWVADVDEDAVGGVFSDEQRPAGTLGGPFLKDRFWFFAAGEGRDRDQSFPRETGSDTGVFTQDVSNYKGHYLSGKLTLQANPSNTIVGFWNTDPIDISNAWARYYLGPSVDPRSEAIQEQGGDNTALQWTSVINPSLLLEVKANSYNGNINIVAQGPIGPEPTSFDLVTGFWSGTSLEEYESKRGREGVVASLTKFLDSSLGSHQIKGGLEYLQIKNEVTDIYYPQGNVLFPVGGAFYYRNERINRPGTLVTKNPYQAIYVQDTWTRNNFTLNVGLRTEQIALENNVGREVLKFDFTDQVAPRIGFAVDVNGNSLHGSASRFYDIVSDYVTASLNENGERSLGYIWLPYFYGPGYCSDDAETADGNLDSDCWALVDNSPLFANNTIEDGIDPTYTDEITIGWDQRLGSNMTAGINFIWREQQDAIEDFDLDNNNSFHYTNQPGTWKEYQALELSIRKRLAADRIQFAASWSHAFKNEGFASGSQLSGFGDSSLAVANRFGRLDTDDLVKLAGSYNIPWGGLPTSTEIGLSAYWYTGPVYAQTRARRVGSKTGTEYVSPERLEVGDQWQADVHLEQSFRFGDNINAAIYGDMFNVTDNQDPTSRNGNTLSANFRRPTGSQAPRRYQLGVKFEF